jgi:hypothetical protein
MPLEDLDPAVDELVERWELAEAAIAAILAGVAAGASAGQLRDAATRIAEILAALLLETTRWIEHYAPEAYRLGARDAAISMALELPREAAREVVDSDTHRLNLQLLAQDLTDDVARATDHINRDAKRILRGIAKRQLQKAMARGNPLARVPDFRAEMEEQGIAFVDRSGRRWKPSTYGRMLLLTHSAIILNAGVVNTAMEFGSPGIRISDGGPGDVDEPCRRANGQHWGVGYALTHPIEHPQCRRGFSPLPRSWQGELDKV